MIKKILSAAAAVIGLSALMGIGASAQEAQYTNIDTYINNYPINAYAVDGKLAVVAEDLRDYGFNVDWDESAWALHISRNDSVSQLTRKDIYKPSHDSGTKFSELYSSGINVDYNGIPMESYALNGYTLITVNELAALAGTEEWNEDNQYYNVWIDGLSVCEYKPLTQRCRNLWYKTKYNGTMPDFVLWDDFNSDGQDDRISLTSKYENIYAVYFMDMRPNDGIKELAIINKEDGDCYYLYLYKLNGESISTCNFYLPNGNRKYYNYDYLYLGHATAYPLTLNDDGSITIQKQTNSAGMWNIYKTYKYDDYGSIVEVPQDFYTVVPSSLTANGADPWGYYPVYKSIYGRGLALNAGNYITPLYDNENNYIYIRKSNGSEGWFSIDFYNYSSGEISPMFFVAG